MKIRKIYIFIIFFSLLILGTIFFNNLNINNTFKKIGNVEKNTEKVAEDNTEKIAEDNTEKIS